MSSTRLAGGLSASVRIQAIAQRFRSLPGAFERAFAIRTGHCTVMRHLLPVIALATCFSTPAWAGWEWTNWGMTTHAVRLAAPKQPARLDEPVKGASLTMRLAVDIETAGIGFRARLGFSEFGELGLVEMRPVDEVRDCAAASRALARLHGAPVSRRVVPTERLLWADAERDSLVEFTRDEDGACLIRLTPLPRRNPYLRG